MSQEALISIAVSGGVSGVVAIILAAIAAVVAICSCRYAYKSESYSNQDATQADLNHQESARECCFGFYSEGKKNIRKTISNGNSVNTQKTQTDYTTLESATAQAMVGGGGHVFSDVAMEGIGFVQQVYNSNRDIPNNDEYEEQEEFIVHPINTSNNLVTTVPLSRNSSDHTTNIVNIATPRGQISNKSTLQRLLDLDLEADTAESNEVFAQLLEPSSTPRTTTPRLIKSKEYTEKETSKFNKAVSIFWRGKKKVETKTEETKNEEPTPLSPESSTNSLEPEFLKRKSSLLIKHFTKNTEKKVKIKSDSEENIADIIIEEANIDISMPLTGDSE